MSTHQDSEHTHRLALPPGTMLQEYRLERMLGKGGFGITYLATDTRLQMPVAIKELLPVDFATRVDGSTVVAQTRSHEDQLAWAVQRFEEEARTLARLNHLNIVRVLRSFPANGTVYLVMEYIEGVSLKAAITRHGPFSDEQTRAILAPLLDGLEYVHSTGLLHRDIKPDNIYLTHGGRPMLLDFGSARQEIQHSVSMTSVVSQGYSPFEQYSTRGKQGPWTDLYALAASMVFVLTGKSGRDSVLADAPDRYAEPEPAGWLAAALGPGHDPVLVSALEHALCVRGTDRPPTVARWKAELFAATTLPPLPPSPPPPPLPTIAPPPTTSTDLNSEERVVKKSGANLMRGIEGVGGWLTLTDRRLLFEAHAINFQSQPETIPLSTVTGVEKCWSKFLGLSLAPTSIEVKTADGRAFRFVVFGREKWIAAILEARRALPQ